MAYYDRDRMMTVASRDINDQQWQKTTLPNQLIWDSHYRVVLGIDDQGYVHVSGNMHVHPLCYFRSEKPHDISRMVAQPMTGRQEDRVTYPQFFNDANKQLLFSYRYGTCGDGNILINRFEPETQRWVRHLDTPLFEGVDPKGDRAAYHRFVKDEQGHFHFLWMWRWDPKVETCHQLCYATSPDLIHWKNAAGKTVNLPFRPDMQDVIVDDAPSKGGLHNSRYQIIVGPDGKPLIGYLKYNDADLTQLYLAKPSGKSNDNDGGKNWASKQISDWSFRWKFIEGGDQMTTGGVFQLAKITDQGSVVIPWSTEQGTAGQYFVNINTLEPATATNVEPTYPAAVHERMTDDPSLFLQLAYDKGGVQKDKVRYVLKWETRTGSHGRHAPKVIPKGPLSKLVLLQIE